MNQPLTFTCRNCTLVFSEPFCSACGANLMPPPASRLEPWADYPHGVPLPAGRDEPVDGGRA